MGSIIQPTNRRSGSGISWAVGTRQHSLAYPIVRESRVWKYFPCKPFAPILAPAHSFGMRLAVVYDVNYAGDQLCLGSPQPIASLPKR